MGLDITAYSKIKRIECEYDDEGDYIDPISKELIEDEIFQAIGNHKSHDRSDGVSGFYTYEDATGFHAGSYRGYNQWRDKLAEIAGYLPIPLKKYGGVVVDSCAASAWKVDGGFFWELINFSDCEGTIGSLTSRKLAKDFEQFQEKVDTLDDERFKYTYADFRAAFEMASEEGCVIF